MAVNNFIESGKEPVRNVLETMKYSKLLSFAMSGLIVDEILFIDISILSKIERHSVRAEQKV